MLQEPFASVPRAFQPFLRDTRIVLSVLIRFRPVYALRCFAVVQLLANASPPGSYYFGMVRNKRGCIIVEDKQALQSQVMENGLTQTLCGADGFRTCQSKLVAKCASILNEM
jgi:hypothetical protein